MPPDDKGRISPEKTHDRISYISTFANRADENLGRRARLSIAISNAVAVRSFACKLIATIIDIRMREVIGVIIGSVSLLDQPIQSIICPGDGCGIDVNYFCDALADMILSSQNIIHAAAIVPLTPA